MTGRPNPAHGWQRRLFWKLMTGAALAAAASGCTPFSKDGEQRPAPLNLSEPAPEPATKPKNPLHAATLYWARQHRENPREAQPALNYAKNLKAMGSKERARSVLEQAHSRHPDHAGIASEYGRLVLANGQPRRALEILGKAGDGDWRVLSARGTAHAKLGRHAEAQRHFTAALRMNPDAESLHNNLALSYALAGSPDRAEKLLRKTIARGNETPRLRQNLALVLGLQRKFDEAQQVAARDLPREEATANMAYLRSMTSDGALSARMVSEHRLADSEAGAPAPEPAGQPRRAATAAAVPPPERRPAVRQPQAGSRRLTSRSAPLPWNDAASAPRPAQARPEPRSGAARTARKTGAPQIAAWRTEVKKAAAREHRTSALLPLPGRE